MPTITIQKSASGATFTVQTTGQAIREYITNDYRRLWNLDNITFSVIDKYNQGEFERIIDKQPFTNIINGDTGLAFGSYAALQAYVRANFFRNAGGTGGRLTAVNFVFGAIPAGAIDGSNVDFSLPDVPTVGTVRLYKNGARLAPNEFSMSGADITYSVAPSNVPFNDTLLADYLK